MRCIALLMAGLVGCASAPEMQARKPPASVQETQAGASDALPVLRVGTSGDYAPFSHDNAGFDIDVARRMASDLGYRVEWVTFDWPELAQLVRNDAFDIAMSGVTWRPDRAVIGRMSRAVASGGPCLLGRRDPRTIAVNRGGILERWARGRFPPSQLRAIDDNQRLPRLLETGAVDAIATDSFELPHFARRGFTAVCEPPRDRKVYWLAPAKAGELGPRVDAWLAEHEPELAQLRAKWLGQASRWSERQHLIDLLARRLSLMPAVAAYKRQHGLPIEDRPREATVLEQAVSEARAAGLAPESVRALFAEQITLAKAVQQRTPPDAQPMDLHGALRPALASLGTRILLALEATAPVLPSLQERELDLLVPLLLPEERRRLLAALRAVRRAS